MRIRIAFVAVAAAFTVGTMAHAQSNPNTIVAQVVIHKDGRRTEYVQKPENRSLETLTRSADGVLVSRQKFKMNAAGEPLSCQIFDGRGALIYRVLYAYDNLGRKTAERTFNRKGRKVRDVFFGYDAQGKAKRPVAMTYPDPDTPKVPTAPMAPILTPGGKVRQNMPAQPQTGR